LAAIKIWSGPVHKAWGKTYPKIKTAVVEIIIANYYVKNKSYKITQNNW